MDATALQALQIHIPGILKGHARKAQEMALSPIQKVDRCIGFAICPAFDRLAISPMPTDIIPGMFCGTFLVWISLCLREFKLSNRDQIAIFSQHGERRKGAVGFLSAGWNEIIDFQFCRLFVHREKYVRDENPVLVSRTVRESAQICHGLKMDSFYCRNPFFCELND
jgi:hypothetical protein